MVNSLKDKYMLPVCDAPIITYNFAALQCSVLQASERDITPYIINKFTNVVMGSHPRTKYIHLHEDEWFKKDNIMHKQHMTLDSEIYKSKPQEILDLIFTFISNDHYLSGNFNIRYINEKHAYNLFDVDIPYLIHGYDLSQKIFYAIGRTKNSKFKRYIISFSEYIEGIFNRKDQMFNLNFIKFNVDFSIKTNYPEIYNGIYDYIFSKNKADGILREGISVNYKYGLDCYCDFCYFLSTVYEYSEFIEPSSFIVFLEHHNIMKLRIDYLNSLGQISDNKIIIEYNDICEKAEMVNKWIESYNSNHSFDLLGKIYNYVDDIIVKEERVLKLLLEQIDTVIKGEQNLQNK